MNDSVGGDRAAPMVRVVVLNWNAGWLTDRCLRSLATTDYPADRFEVVLVDNGSIDGSLERLRHDHPGLRIVENGTNLGFAEGCNRAMRDVEAFDHVALVNNDATVARGWLRPLVDALEADQRVGAAAPKILLESSFGTIEEIEAGLRIVAVLVDGVEVTRRCIFEHFESRPHPRLPLDLVHTAVAASRLHLPVPDDTASTAVTLITEDLMGRRREVSATVAPGRHRRINSLGTELTPWTEGRERRYGDPDDPSIEPAEVWGFSGGGVLLRGAMLDEVGWFDPSFFAYYEDTDLAWRAHRHGWTVRAVPASVLSHLHGGSAGSEARGFFFLNYRNWLWTVLRNGSPTQAAQAFAVVRRAVWRPFRSNVFGPLRRGRRPDARIVRGWLRVLVGVAVGLPSVVGARAATARVGVRSVAASPPRLMPATDPRPPRPRPGGPLIVWVDVTETLRSGWRAGIQRVTAELVRALPATEPAIELVELTWNPLREEFRRLDGPEVAQLLAPTARQRPREPGSASRSVLRRAASHVGRRVGVTGEDGLVARLRHRGALAQEPPSHRLLAVDPAVARTVFLDVDASWNTTTVDRATLLPRLVAAGGRSVLLLHDLLPQEHPEWFIRELVAVSTAHLDAHLDAGSFVLCNSRATESSLVAYCRREGRPPPDTVVVDLGADPPRHRASPGPGTEIPTRPDLAPDARIVLMVGTVEPRKNHRLVLDAFESLTEAHPELHLVVVGRPGWRNDDVLERLRSDPSGRVHWFDDCSDDELDGLYRRAFLVVVPSFTEGFGLPVIEALAAGCCVVSSTGGALPEAGGDLVEYVSPDDTAALAATIGRHLDDPAHHDAMRAGVARFRAPTWARCAEQVAAALLSDPRRR